MTLPVLPVYDWTRIDRDPIRLEGFALDGVPATTADLTAALLPTTTAGPDDTTTWATPTPDPVDDTPLVLIAGPDADTSSALELTGDAILWVRVVKGGATKAAPFARLHLLT